MSGLRQPSLDTHGNRNKLPDACQLLRCNLGPGHAHDARVRCRGDMVRKRVAHLCATVLGRGVDAHGEISNRQMRIFGKRHEDHVRISFIKSSLSSTTTAGRPRLLGSLGSASRQSTRTIWPAVSFTWIRPQQSVCPNHRRRHVHPRTRPHTLPQCGSVLESAHVSPVEPHSRPCAVSRWKGLCPRRRQPHLVRNPGMVPNETICGVRRFHRVVFQRCVRCPPILHESFKKLE